MAPIAKTPFKSWSPVVGRPARLAVVPPLVPCLVTVLYPDCAAPLLLLLELTLPLLLLLELALPLLLLLELELLELLLLLELELLELLLALEELLGSGSLSSSYCAT